MYIHLIEPTSTPERAEKAADTLLNLMPAAGHMIHMASHIYQRIGRYADSMKSNQLAIAADENNITQCMPKGYTRWSIIRTTFTFSGSQPQWMVKARLQSNLPNKLLAKLTMKC
jgi:hypothetical protein